MRDHSLNSKYTTLCIIRSYKVPIYKYSSIHKNVSSLLCFMNSQTHLLIHLQVLTCNSQFTFHFNLLLITQATELTTNSKVKYLTTKVVQKYSKSSIYKHLHVGYLSMYWHRTSSKLGTNQKQKSTCSEYGLKLVVQLGLHRAMMKYTKCLIQSVNLILYHLSQFLWSPVPKMNMLSHTENWTLIYPYLWPKKIIFIMYKMFLRITF